MNIVQCNAAGAGCRWARPTARSFRLRVPSQSQSTASVPQQLTHCPNKGRIPQMGPIVVVQVACWKLGDRARRTSGKPHAGGSGLGLGFKLSQMQELLRYINTSLAKTVNTSGGSPFRPQGVAHRLPEIEGVSCNRQVNVW